MVTGYDGTFLVDPRTTDLVRLTIRTNELPSETAACYAYTMLDYTRVRLKGDEFLLPSASLLRVLSTDAGASENHTVFSSCHEFLGESTIMFDSPPNARVPDGANTSKPQAFVLPPGLASGWH